MELGLYEQLINKVISAKLNQLDKNKFYIKQTNIDKAEAAKLLAQYLSSVVKYALSLISGDDSIRG
ncbi:MAG: hypothetical protein BGN96_09110 [Bacteroidales bacterium 45-6]|nr:MAG: hypothetical protein BGN96_09110 [Bacteroidales bacterium 45-6]